MKIWSCIKAFRYFPLLLGKSPKIIVIFKTPVGVAPTFLSNLMFYYSSYFLYSSPSGHLSFPWVCCSFPSSLQSCVHTPLLYSSFRFELFEETFLDIGLLRSKIRYMLLCTLLICVWLFPPSLFLSTICQRYRFYGQHNDWERILFNIHTVSEYD